MYLLIQLIELIYVFIKERDRYFTCFKGVNESEIKLKTEKQKMYQNTLQLNRNQHSQNEEVYIHQHNQRQEIYQNHKSDYGRFSPFPEKYVKDAKLFSLYFL